MDEKSFTMTFTDVEINEEALRKITGIDDTKISTKEVQKITEEIEQHYAERIKGLKKEIEKLQKQLTFIQGENAGLRYAFRLRCKDVEF